MAKQSLKTSIVRKHVPKKKKSLPVYERTDWDALRSELSQCWVRLRVAPPETHRYPPTNVRQILNAHATAEIGIEEAIDLLPVPINERRDWNNLRQLILDIRMKLRLDPSWNDEREKISDNPYAVLDGYLYGYLYWDEATKKLERHFGFPIDKRTDVYAIRNQITALLARLQELEEQTVIDIPLTTPGRVLLAYREGRLSEARASALLDEMVGRAHQNGMLEGLRMSEEKSEKNAR